jgi:hypothetical protein
LKKRQSQIQRTAILELNKGALSCTVQNIFFVQGKDKNFVLEQYYLKYSIITAQNSLLTALKALANKKNVYKKLLVYLNKL